MNILNLKTQPRHVPIKNSFCYPFRPLFDRRNRAVENGSKRSRKAVLGQQMTKDKTILLDCSVMLNYQLEVLGEEFVTSIGL